MYEKESIIGAFHTSDERGYYWSSTEMDDINAWFKYFGAFQSNYDHCKYGKCYVRAIRAF